MTTVWFTADTHFGHKRIPLYARRRFCMDAEELEEADSIWSNKNQYSTWSPSWSAIARMDEQLISKINDCVRENDILWHLGDFSFGKRKDFLETANKYRSRIKCRNVFLIRGNHDNPNIGGLFGGIYDTHEIKIQSKHIVMSHYAHAFWNKSHYGSWNLYGHAHGSAEGWLDEHMPGRLSIDVGVDNIFRIKGEYRPISFEELSDIFSKTKGFHTDGQKK